MMNEYAASIPGLDVAANWLVDPEHSQAVYDAFRMNVDSAQPVTMDGASESAGEHIEVLWNWLNEQSEDLSDWVEDAVEFE